MRQKQVYGQQDECKHNNIAPMNAWIMNTPGEPRRWKASGIRRTTIQETNCRLSLVCIVSFRSSDREVYVELMNQRLLRAKDARASTASVFLGFGCWRWFLPWMNYEIVSLVASAWPFWSWRRWKGKSQCHVSYSVSQSVELFVHISRSHVSIPHGMKA